MFKQILFVLLFMYLVLLSQVIFALDSGNTAEMGGVDPNTVPTIDYSNKDVYEDKSPGRKFPNILNSDDVQDYEESSLRRFDIIFFLALPVFIGYQFIMHEVISSYYPVNNLANNTFSINQYVYIALSSVMLGLAVAYDDYRKVSIGEGSSYDQNERKRSISLAVQFNF